MNTNINHMMWSHKHRSVTKLRNVCKRIICYYVAYMAFMVCCIASLESRGVFNQTEPIRIDWDTISQQKSSNNIVVESNNIHVSHHVIQANTLVNTTDALKTELDNIYKSSKQEKTMYLTDTVNVRESPSTNSNIIKTVYKNMCVDVLASSGEWSFVRLSDGTTAYMCNKWFTDEKIVNSYTEEDLYILSHILAGECQYCPDDEQRYVASVVINRVNSKKFPNTIKEVAFQQNSKGVRQYSCVKDGNFCRKPTQSNIDNAIYILENGSILPPHVIYQSRGKQGSGTYLKTEYHYYCY